MLHLEMYAIKYVYTIVIFKKKLYVSGKQQRKRKINKLIIISSHSIFWNYHNNFFKFHYSFHHKCVVFSFQLSQNYPNYRALHNGVDRDKA